MNKHIVILVTIAIVAFGIIMNTVLSNQKEPMRRNPGGQGQLPVKVITVKNEKLQTELNVTGHLTALNKVEIFAEVSGLLLNTQKRFIEGNRFLKGEVLIRIDDSVYRNNVLAQKSALLNQLTLLLPDLSIDFPQSTEAWRIFLDEFELETPLPPLPPVQSDQEKYYIASRNIFNLYYQVKSMEETWAKYTIEAPYNGIVSLSNINPGALVRVGQKLGEFTNTDVYELAAPVSVDQVQYLRVGDRVKMTSEDIEGEFEGRIERINEIIDRRTQTVTVYIHTRNDRLKDGMFLVARVFSRPIDDAMWITEDLLVGTDHVYTVNQDSILTLQKVDVISNQSGGVIVRGLSDGQKIVGQPLTNASEGTKIKIAGRN